MTQPRHIEATYTTTASYDLEEIEKELNISWDDVDDYWIKWCRLNITMKDGSTHEVESLPGDIDWKRPLDVRLLDEEFNEVEE